MTSVYINPLDKTPWSLHVPSLGRAPWSLHAKHLNKLCFFARECMHGYRVARLHVSDCIFCINRIHTDCRVTLKFWNLNSDAPWESCHMTSDGFSPLCYQPVWIHTFVESCCMKCDRSSPLCWKSVWIYKHFVELLDTFDQSCWLKCDRFSLLWCHTLRIQIHSTRANPWYLIVVCNHLIDIFHHTERLVCIAYVLVTKKKNLHQRKIRCTVLVLFAFFFARVWCLCYLLPTWKRLRPYASNQETSHPAHALIQLFTVRRHSVEEAVDRHCKPPLSSPFHVSGFSSPSRISGLLLLARVSRTCPSFCSACGRWGWRLDHRSLLLCVAERCCKCAETAGWGQRSITLVS